MTQQSESLLIADLKKGSVRAFEALYQMYATRLYAFCLTYTKQRDDAKDIVQETFYHLWQVRESIRSDATLKPLLFTMVRNRTLNHLSSTLNAPVFEDYVAYGEQLAADAPTDRRIEYAEFVREVDALIDALPPAQRSIFKLSRRDGLSNREIALRLSLSEQTVKNQLSSALKQLRQRLRSVTGYLPTLICMLLLKL